MKTGALIVAAGMSSRMGDFKPMLKLGSISIVQRIISTLQKSGIDLIIVITGYKATILEKHISKYHVICLRNEQYETTQMIDSAKLGLEYMINLCDQIIFTPVDIPLFTEATVKNLFESKAQDKDTRVIVPTYEKKSGHPILIDREMAEKILLYKGEEGIRGAIKNSNALVKFIEVNDKGILFDADTPEDYREILEYHNNHLLRPEANISLVKEIPFFNKTTAMLLDLIRQSQSVRTACEMMNISYSSGWNLLKTMERQLGYAVVIRHPGGENGGYTVLSEKGERLLQSYKIFIEESNKAIQEIYNKIFNS